jgi:trigger factor
MSPDQFAQALVEANQVGMAMQDIRRAKALAIVMEGAAIVDSDGAVVDLSLLDEA